MAARQPTRPSEQSPRNGSEEIDLTPHEGAERPPADPSLMATRSEGLPDSLTPNLVITGPESEVGQPNFRYLPSDAGSDHSSHSRIISYTLFDRGEKQYARIQCSDTPLPPVKIEEDPEFEGLPLYEKLSYFMKEPLPTQNQASRFLPRGYLEEILTEKVVREAISERDSTLDPRDIARYAQKVCQNPLPSQPESEPTKLYRKIFGVLALIEREADIALIIDDESGLCDADLPLQTFAIEGTRGRKKVLCRKSNPDKPLACFSRWSLKQHVDFEREQWSLLAPFFAKEDGQVAQFYQLSENDILPWTFDSGVLHQGGFSFISQIKIHSSHYRFPRAKTSPTVASGCSKSAFDERFAVKHFKINLNGGVQTMSSSFPQSSYQAQDDIRREFEQEIEILNRFSDGKNQHLISLLAAYGRGIDYCLLFPWADYDLGALWKNKTLWEKTQPGLPPDKHTLVWMVDQCLGMAGGLRNIHNYKTKSNLLQDHHRIYGRHGDIKPDNILVFLDPANPQSRGTLVITDFGLTRFHSDHTKTYFKRDIPMTPTYRPPECDMHGGSVSRSFDIWSYGCVLLEFVTWYLGGPDLLVSFVQKRKTPDPQFPGIKSDQFFEIVRSKGLEDGDVTLSARVKMEILEFVSDLRSHENCSDVVHSLLDLIMDRMLVVEYKGIQGRQRANGEQVYLELRDIQKRLDKIVRSPGGLVATPRQKTKVSIPDAVVMPDTEEIRSLYRNRDAIAQVPEHRGRVLGAADHFSIRSSNQIGGLTRRISTN
ncbi:hypothetical protein QBC47DRAFT_366332 [Echria macrotheca]|uniref:Protein kinase domain-containing protein n=1 Tax=Echria macrotheca TaxID=438768 RepID=A0AAJ0BMR0_9PEZI|nr:hypothetical protein QBC47DRAFT_366332 [Echria macrotheca]